MPAATRAADTLTTALQRATDWWKSLSREAQDSVIKGAATAGAIGLIAIAFGKVATSILWAIEAWQKAKTLGLLGRIGPAAAVIGAGIAAVELVRRAPLPQEGKTIQDWARGGPEVVFPKGYKGSVPAWARPMPVAVPKQLLGQRILKKITEIDALIPQFSGATLEKLQRDRAKLVADAQRKGIALPPGVAPSSLAENPLIADLQKRINEADDEAEKSKAEAAASKARRAANARERLDLQVQEAMGYGWRDSDQTLSQYLAWQHQGEAGQMGRGLAGGMQGIVDLMASALRRAQTTGFTGAMSGALGGISGGFSTGWDRAQQWRREVTGPQLMGVGPGAQHPLMGSLQGMFGGVMGVGDTAQAAAAQMQRQAQFEWEEQMAEFKKRAEGTGKIKDGFKRAFGFLPSLAGDLADEFQDSFATGLQKAFGKNPLGRALARTIDRWLGSLLDQAMAGLFKNQGGSNEGEGEVSGQVSGKGKFGMLLGAGLGSIFGGGIGGTIGGALGSMLGFAEGGTIPGPPGRARIAVVHGGEVVLNQRQQAAVAGGGSITVNLGGVTISNKTDAASVGREIAWQIQQRIRTLPGG